MDARNIPVGDINLDAFGKHARGPTIERWAHILDADDALKDVADDREKLKAVLVVAQDRLKAGFAYNTIPAGLRVYYDHFVGAPMKEQKGATNVEESQSATAPAKDKNTEAAPKAAAPKKDKPPKESKKTEAAPVVAAADTGPHVPEIPTAPGPFAFVLSEKDFLEELVGVKKNNDIRESFHAKLFVSTGLAYVRLLETFKILRKRYSRSFDEAQDGGLVRIVEEDKKGRTISAEDLDRGEYEARRKKYVDQTFDQWAASEGLYPDDKAKRTLTQYAFVARQFANVDGHLDKEVKARLLVVGISRAELLARQPQAIPLILNGVPVDGAPVPIESLSFRTLKEILGAMNLAAKPATKGEKPKTIKDVPKLLEKAMRSAHEVKTSLKGFSVQTLKSSTVQQLIAVKEYCLNLATLLEEELKLSEYNKAKPKKEKGRPRHED